MIDISIYIKLRIANAKGKVRISPEYKHLDYMLDKNLVSPIYDGVDNTGKFFMLTHSDWYEITKDGKEIMFHKDSHLITRLISVIALIVSIIALWINFQSK